MVTKDPEETAAFIFRVEDIYPATVVYRSRVPGFDSRRFQIL
jgi:hypothetical protein